MQNCYSLGLNNRRNLNVEALILKSALNRLVLQMEKNKDKIEAVTFAEIV